MHTVTTKLFAAVVLLTVVSGVGIGSAAASASHSTSPLIRFTNDSIVADATAALTRNREGASMTLKTSELTPGHTVTVFWVIFNEPDACTHPHGTFRCGPGDLPSLGGGSAQPSVLPASDKTIGPESKATFAGHLEVGDTKGALFGPGLTEPRGADIHLVVCDGTQFSPSCAIQFAVFEA